MEKKVSSTIVSASLPSTTNAGLAAAPIVTTEGLSFLGVSVSDWEYLAVFAFYALSALHVIYKIWVRHRWVQQNLDAPKDGIVKVSRIINNSELIPKILEAERLKKERESREDFIDEK